MGQWQHGAVPQDVSHHDAGIDSPHHFALLTLLLILTFKFNRHSSQVIAAVDKPKIERVTLLMLYVMALYADEHADVLATIMTNCVKLVETTIEYHNNRVSNYVPKNVTNLTIENYEFATSICVPVDTLMREMRELFSGAKSVSAQLPPSTLPRHIDTHTHIHNLALQINHVSCCNK